MYEEGDDKVTKFDLDESVIDAVRNLLKDVDGNQEGVLEEAAVLVLIPLADGRVFFGADRRGGTLDQEKVDDIEKNGIRPRALTSAAFFIGEGCHVMWSYVGGSLTRIKLPCRQQ